MTCVTAMVMSVGMSSGMVLVRIFKHMSVRTHPDHFTRLVGGAQGSRSGCWAV
jgi:uncharacterized protein YodC (DUF2158 family)